MNDLQYIIPILQKPVQWVMLVLVLTVYLFMRAASLPFKHKLSSGILSAVLAYVGSAELSLATGWSENITTIAIMIGGPVIVGIIYDSSTDETFVKDTLKSWARKQLGLGAYDGEDK